MLLTTCEPTTFFFFLLSLSLSLSQGGGRPRFRGVKQRAPLLLEQWQGDGTPIAVANDGLALHRHAPRIPTPRPPTP